MATVDSYPESNVDSAMTMYAGTASEICQAFYASATSVLTSVSLYLKKYGSPTGLAYVKIYAITGTPGSDATPTGSVLATSDAFDVATLSTSYALTQIAFSGLEQISLSAATWYAVAITYTGGGSTHRLEIAYDTTSPSHAGNYASYQYGSWTAWSSIDLCFYVSGNIIYPFGETVDTITIASVCSLEVTLPGISCVDLASVVEVVTVALPMPILCNTALVAPVSSLSANFGSRLTLDSSCPVSYAEGNFGAVLVQTAPVSEGEGSASSVWLCTLNKKAPISTCYGSFGAVLDARVSTATCVAESYSLAIDADSFAPVSVLSGSLFEEISLSLDEESPVATAAAVMYASGILGHGTAPVDYMLEFTAYEVIGAVLNAVAPISLVVYSAVPGSNGSLSVSAYAPVATMLSDTGFGDTESAELSDGSRFTLYTLEYAR